MKEIEEAERLAESVRMSGTETTNEDLLACAVIQLCAVIRGLTGKDQ